MLESVTLVCVKIFVAASYVTFIWALSCVMSPAATLLHIQLPQMQFFFVQIFLSMLVCVYIYYMYTALNTPVVTDMALSYDYNIFRNIGPP